MPSPAGCVGHRACGCGDGLELAPAWPLLLSSSSSNSLLIAPTSIFKTLPVAGVMSTTSLPKCQFRRTQPITAQSTVWLATHRSRPNSESNLCNFCRAASSLPKKMNWIPTCLFTRPCCSNAFTRRLMGLSASDFGSQIPLVKT